MMNEKKRKERVIVVLLVVVQVITLTGVCLVANEQGAGNITDSLAYLLFATFVLLDLITSGFFLYIGRRYIQ